MAADGVMRGKKSPFGQLLDVVVEEHSKIGPWNEDLQHDLPKKWEKHGDMVLLPENSFTLKEWRMLGRNLWKVVAHCLQAERVGRKRRIEKDDYRSPHIELLYGQHGWVEHVDNGISYHYDVTKCMFSIGNINEKIRIANMDCRFEVVVDMFAGIGYFTLPYLVHAKAQLVHACEWNPDAIEALVKNLTANKVDDRCVVHEGDCRKVCPVSVADRVNLGLLPSARAYWLPACKALKPTGGILHVHENVTSSKLKKSMSRQESVISNSDVIVGDSITVQYCYDEEEGAAENGKDPAENASTRKQSTAAKETSAAAELRKDQSSSRKPKKEGSPLEAISKAGKEQSPPRPTSKSRKASSASESSKPPKPPANGPAVESKSNHHVQRQDSAAPGETTETQAARMIRCDSLFEEEIDFYEPPIHESFQSDWVSGDLDGNWKQFSIAAARRMRRFLNNLHDAEWDVVILRVGKVKSYAPRIDHIVLDLECRPIKTA